MFIVACVLLFAQPKYQRTEYIMVARLSPHARRLSEHAMPYSADMDESLERKLL